MLKTCRKAPRWVRGLRTAAKLAGCSPSGLQKMVDNGDVPAKKVRGVYLFAASDLEERRQRHALATEMRELLGSSHSLQKVVLGRRLHWTKERPTVPGFYFMRVPLEQLPFDGATTAPITIHKVIVVEAMKYAEMQFWQGPFRYVDLPPTTEFAGPIPLPEDQDATIQGAK